MCIQLDHIIDGVSMTNHFVYALAVEEYFLAKVQGNEFRQVLFVIRKYRKPLPHFAEIK